MLVSMSLKQNEHGVWCVRKKVPERLASVARAQLLEAFHSVRPKRLVMVDAVDSA